MLWLESAKSLGSCDPTAALAVHRTVCAGEPTVTGGGSRWSRLLSRMVSIGLETLGDRVHNLGVGKRVGGAVYIHRNALEQCDPDLLGVLCSWTHSVDAEFVWNVCKLSPYRQQLSLLHYPRFREDEHPALSAAAIVDLNSGEARVRRYSPNGNQPILHRKELLLDASDPDYARFAALTEQEERAGLFSAPSTIGHERGWSKQLERRGVVIRGHRVLRNGE